MKTDDLAIWADEFPRRSLRNRRNLAEAERLALAEIVGRETVVERDERGVITKVAIADRS